MDRKEFFADISQEVLSINGNKIKVPTCLYKGKALFAVYPVLWHKVNKLMPSQSFIPLMIGPDISLCIINVFDLTDTDLGQYRELGVVFPVSYQSSIFLKLPSLTKDYLNVLLSNFSAYLYKMPVSTEISKIGGTDLWGFPKFLSSIDFQEEDDINFRVAEGGQEILSVSAKKLEPALKHTIRINFYQSLNDKIQMVPMDIKVNGNLGLNPVNCKLDLGEHSLAAELKDLLLSPYPILWIWADDMMAIIHRPSEVF